MIKVLAVTVSANMTTLERWWVIASNGNQTVALTRIHIRRNIAYTDIQLILPLYGAIIKPQLEYPIQAWRLYHTNDMDTFSSIHGSDDDVWYNF